MVGGDRTLLLTVDQACDQLQIGRSLLLQKLYANEIPSVRVGRRRLVPTSSLEEYVEKLQAKQAADDGGA
jgi:excisionase family DNA binding protein